MDDLPTFDLVLFDFDGLLINSERLHYEAYRTMFANRGYEMAWSFPRYCMAAHYESTGLREAAYATISGLKDHEPDWAVLYKEKKEAFCRLVKEGHVCLMPGVEALLKRVSEAGVHACVVTNSPPDAVGEVRRQIPALSAVTDWVTREQYDNPKPAPDGYLSAIERFANKDARIIGFEDTIRGARSLLEAYDQIGGGEDKVTVLVSELELVGLDALKERYLSPIRRFQSFVDQASCSEIS